MRSFKNFTHLWATFTIFLFLFAGNILAAKGDTIWIPVTYFDFHSNGSNPEFEAPHITGIKTGMVQKTLDKDRLPILGPNPYLNQYIRYWFRGYDSKDGAKGNFDIPVYEITNQSTLGNFLNLFNCKL